MDRPLFTTVARTGGRLVAALLPLAAYGVVRMAGTGFGLPPWVEPAVAGVGAAVAAIALLLTIAAHLEQGRLRDVADAIGLGLLAATFGGLAVSALHPFGLGLGALGAAFAFGAGSALGRRRAAGRRWRWIGVLSAVLVIDAWFAAALFLAAASAGAGAATFLLVDGALLTAVSALVTWPDAGRATALAIAASSFAALALAGSPGAERLPGVGGITVAAALLGWTMVARRLGQNAATSSNLPATPTLPEVRSRLQQIPDAIAEPEYDEVARLTRELRATLDDLVAARRTIGLQRAEIERASTVDPLTGVPSRGPTLDRLRTEAAEARRYAHPVTVVLIDIDGFAATNHDYGLTVGDTILREVALRLRLRIREADALGRIGGDAFLAILPHTDEGGAATFAQALLDRLVERPFATDRGEIAVSLSIGIALMRAGMTLSGEELLAAAEEALASAKAAGGNRIAFDRLHGLARLDERRHEVPSEGSGADSASG